MTSTRRMRSARWRSTRSRRSSRAPPPPGAGRRPSPSRSTNWRRRSGALSTPPLTPHAHPTRPPHTRRPTRPMRTPCTLHTCTSPRRLRATRPAPRTPAPSTSWRHPATPRPRPRAPAPPRRASPRRPPGPLTRHAIHETRRAASAQASAKRERERADQVITLQDNIEEIQNHLASRPSLLNTPRPRLATRRLASRRAATAAHAATHRSRRPRTCSGLDPLGPRGWARGRRARTAWGPRRGRSQATEAPCRPRAASRCRLMRHA